MIHPRRTRLVLASALLVAAIPGRSYSGPEPAALHVRVRSDLLGCLRPAVEAFAAARSLTVELEAGVAVPAPHVDVLVGTGSDVARVMEGGLAREGEVVLGTIQKPGHQRMVIALALKGAPHPRAADDLLQFFRGADVREAFATCAAGGVSAARRSAGSSSSPDVEAASAPTGEFAQALVDWWIPQCSLAYNLARYGDPVQVLGRPDAWGSGEKDDYTGFTSLGAGGYVVVDMGRSIPDQAGDDVRVFQTASYEPVTLYGADGPDGPFRLIARQRDCGEKPRGLEYSRHCDFDLGQGALPSARYFRIEDGESYPCIAGGTATEGPDIDAVEILEP